MSMTKHKYLEQPTGNVSELLYTDFCQSEMEGLLQGCQLSRTMYHPSCGQVSKTERPVPVRIDLAQKDPGENRDFRIGVRPLLGYSTRSLVGRLAVCRCGGGMAKGRKVVHGPGVV